MLTFLVPQHYAAGESAFTKTTCLGVHLYLWKRGLWGIRNFIGMFTFTVQQYYAAGDSACNEPGCFQYVVEVICARAVVAGCVHANLCDTLAHRK